MMPYSPDVIRELAEEVNRRQNEKGVFYYKGVIDEAVRYASFFRASGKIALLDALEQVFVDYRSVPGCAPVKSWNDPPTLRDIAKTMPRQRRS